MRSVSPLPGRSGREPKKVAASDLEKFPSDDPKNMMCNGGFAPSLTGVVGIDESESGVKDASRAEEALEIGDISLDCARPESLDDKSVSLTF